MYLEINYLSPEELDKIKSLFEDKKIRPIKNIYQEVCRVETECTLAQLLPEQQIDEIENDINYNAILDEIAEDIHDNADSIFQELCDLTAERIKKYF